MEKWSVEIGIFQKNVYIIMRVSRASSILEYSQKFLF